MNVLYIFFFQEKKSKKPPVSISIISNLINLISIDRTIHCPYILGVIWYSEFKYFSLEIIVRYTILRRILGKIKKYKKNKN